MRPQSLCLERPDRVRRVRNRAAGKMTVRELMRSFAIRPWKIEQAATLGWVKVYIRAGKGGKGRPSRVVELNTQDRLADSSCLRSATKSPKAINMRHQSFANVRRFGVRSQRNQGSRVSRRRSGLHQDLQSTSYAGARADECLLMDVGNLFSAQKQPMLRLSIMFRRDR